MEERLAQMEARLNDLTRDGSRSSQSIPSVPATRDSNYINNNNGNNSNNNTTDFNLRPDALVQASATSPVVSDSSPSASSIGSALRIYFQRCHRQLIWLFNPEEIVNYGSLADEVALALLALTSWFGLEGSTSSHQRYLRSARKLVMSHIADGSVRLSTIEALCIISQSCFIAGELSLGRFHISLGLELCAAASMDVATGYQTDSHMSERKTRAFWSLQMLKAYHGKPTESTDVLDCLQLDYDNADERRRGRTAPPNFPIDDNNASDQADYGIWSILLQLACAWGRARAYVRSCINDKVREPWCTDSSYARILEELTKIEGRTPMRHRWQNIKFNEQDQNELDRNGYYWKPCLAVQFIYHNVLATINHPFLYMAAAQQKHNKPLAMLNTFWTRSSQLALLHATWIVRLAEMTSDRQVEISDAIFGQALAIAATIHLYYLSAVNPKLKMKSAVDLIKAKRFLQISKAASPLCTALDDRVESLLHAASSTHWSDFVRDPPAQVSLNARLMWEVLALACSDQYDIFSPTGDSGGPSGPGGSSSDDTSNRSSDGLLHWSLISSAQRPRQQEPHQQTEEVVFEVGYQAVSPDVTVDTSDGGQSAPMRIFDSTTGVHRTTSSATPASVDPATVTASASEPPKGISRPAATPIASLHQHYHNFGMGMAATSGGASGAALQVQAFPNADILANDLRNTSWLWDGSGRNAYMHGGAENNDYDVYNDGFRNDDSAGETGARSVEHNLVANSNWWWDLGNL